MDKEMTSNKDLAMMVLTAIAKGELNRINAQHRETWDTFPPEAQEQITEVFVLGFISGFSFGLKKKPAESTDAE